jgi:hypothetical protein
VAVVNGDEAEIERIRQELEPYVKREQDFAYHQKMKEIERKDAQNSTTDIKIVD